MIDKPYLNSLGYIVIQMTERSWRIRGIERFVTVWPVVKKYRWGAYSKESEPYEDLMGLLARVIPFPLPTEEERAATSLWQKGVDQLYDRLACRLTIPLPGT